MNMSPDKSVNKRPSSNIFSAILVNSLCPICFESQSDMQFSNCSFVAFVPLLLPK